jgi:S-methylmethionine-dependent homocysteine/selenocysteine methylase
MTMQIDPRRTYFLDGATGTEIQRRGYAQKLPLWSGKVLFDQPDMITAIHRDYIRAGADIITTNTFRTQRRTLTEAGLGDETERINRLAVDCAVKAREEAQADRPVYIAASITTLADCYHPELVPEPSVCEAEHTEQIELLASTPIDLFILETFNTISEAEISARIAASTGKPFIVSFTANEDGNILSGESWEDAVAQIRHHAPLAFMVNCVPPEVATRALDRLIPYACAAGIAYGAYANGAGVPEDDAGWNFDTKGSPMETYAQTCRRWKNMRATIIGGCCGTTPEYTKKYSAMKE